MAEAIATTDPAIPTVLLASALPETYSAAQVCDHNRERDSACFGSFAMAEHQD